MSKFLVDIILPVYNSENFILKTIESILNQKFKSWRLMIVDDNSSDNTYKIIKENYSKYIKNKKFFLYQNSKNRGQSFSRNFLLKKIKAELVAFIDSDDLWKKNKLYKQIIFMKKNKYDFTFTNYKVLNQNKIINVVKAPKFINYNNFIHNTCIATSTIILTRKAIGKLLFPNIRLCEDYIFKCNLLKKFTAFNLSETNTYYRIRKGSLQSKRLRVFFAVWRINKEYNNMNLFQNLLSLYFISLNSLKKYAFR